MRTRVLENLRHVYPVSCPIQERPPDIEFGMSDEEEEDESADAPVVDDDDPRHHLLRGFVSLPLGHVDRPRVKVSMKCGGREIRTEGAQEVQVSYEDESWHVSKSEAFGPIVPTVGAAHANGGGSDCNVSGAPSLTEDRRDDTPDVHSADVTS